eukprot:1640877-Alexandrium_andersonii.AAC.1
MGMGAPHAEAPGVLIDELLGGEVDGPDPDVTCPICQAGQQTGELWAFWPGNCSHRFHHQCTANWITSRLDVARPSCCTPSLSPEPWGLPPW